jgi:NADPH2:quinone reductase
MTSNLPPTMRAVQVRETGGPEALEPVEVPLPSPAAGEVLIRVGAAGVNFIDVYQRRGLYAVPTPFIAGSEAAGTVVASGSAVENFRIGDRVAYSGVLGAYAEYASVPADRVVGVPGNVSDAWAASLMLQGMTAHYLATSTHALSLGDGCLVHAAAGGVGLLLCQIARSRGAHVIGTVSTDAKAEMASDAGARDVIIYTREDFVKAVRRITSGRGVNVVYDSVGRTTFDGSLDCLAPRGMLVLFGQSCGRVPPLDPQVLNRKGSLFLTRPTIGHYVAAREELEARAKDLFEWIVKGELRLSIGRRYPLAEARQAHADLESRNTSGKLLLIP